MIKAVGKDWSREKMGVHREEIKDPRSPTVVV